MGQLWEEILQEGSFDGIKFDFVSVRDERGNDLDLQRFPNRDGTRVEARGQSGARYDVMAIFIEDDYPDSDDPERGMVKLIAALNNGGAVKKLVHPIFGEVNAACERFTTSHDVEDARDSATIQITFVEDNGLVAGPIATTTTAPAQANAVRSLSDQVFTALSAFQAASEVQNSPIGLAVVGAMNAATSTADSLQAAGADLSTLAIQATTNGALATVNVAVAALADYETTEQYELSAAILAMGEALSALAQTLIEQRPPLSYFPVVADTNLLQLAFDLGADADELLTLNSIPDPSFIPAGFQVLAYAVAV